MVGSNRSLNCANDVKGLQMLKLAYKVGSRGSAMVSTSAQNVRDPWFESRSWYDRFLYVNIHLFILMPVSCSTSNLLKILNSDTEEHL